MTEQEAARYLQALTFNISRRKLPRDTETINAALEAVVMGMKALEEIQQYRALGTLKELREAREKQRAKKPFIQKTDEKTLYKCPCCKNVFVEAYENLQRGYIPKHCEMCGQSIDF